jgi:hypothetical protein
LERAKEVDSVFQKSGVDVTKEGHFNPTLFRQPSLTEGDLKPAVYRHSCLNIKRFGADTFVDSEAPDDEVFEDEETDKEIDALLESHKKNSSVEEVPLQVSCTNI